MSALPPATTTRTAELANNTSSYDGYCSISQPFYTGQPPRTLDHFQAGCPDVNKNELGNVSHAQHRTLLYPGSTTLITAHFMPWFEHTKFHAGYSSNTVAQVQKQVADAKARGIDGFITDYYTKYEGVMLKLKDECERRGDFWFAHDWDQGIISSLPNADKQATLISTCKTIAAKYYGSPRYLRYRYTGTKWVQDQVNGRPLLLFFGIAAHNAWLDWNAIRTALSGADGGNPLIIHRNSDAYAGTNSDGVSDGAYAWTTPTSVYQKASLNPTKLTIGAAAKGFWDDGASWGDARYTGQNNGNFWLGQWALVNQYFSASFELPIMQIVTWNDWEEGTAAECGVGNHISLPVTLTNGNLAWSVTGGGGIATVDSFKVWASQDGNNLSLLADLPITQQTYNLVAYGLPAGTYQVFVQAIGKPGIHNKLATSVDFVSTTAPTNPPTVTIDSTVPSPATGLAPLAVTFNATATAVGPATIVSTVWDFGDGATAATEDASHTYTAPGTYTATLVATDSVGKTASASVVITATEDVPAPPPEEDIDESIPKDPLDPSRPICARWRKRKSEIGEQQ